MDGFARSLHTSCIHTCCNQTQKPQGEIHWNPNRDMRLNLLHKEENAPKACPNALELHRFSPNKVHICQWSATVSSASGRSHSQGESTHWGYYDPCISHHKPSIQALSACIMNWLRWHVVPTGKCMSRLPCDHREAKHVRSKTRQNLSKLKVLAFSVERVLLIEFPCSQSQLRPPPKKINK